MTASGIRSRLARPGRQVGGRWLAALLATALLGACGGAHIIGEESASEESASEESTGVENESTEQEMAMGETVEMDGGHLRLTFEGVPFDNRCPRDVQCIVAGMAKVTLLARIEGGEEQSLTLELGPRGPKTVEHLGYAMTLLEVEPYPVSTRTIEPQDYRVRLRCEPGTP